jgi:hypothetical protein
MNTLRLCSLRAERASITELSGHVLEPLRAGADVTDYRGRRHGSKTPVLAVALAPGQPASQSLRLLEYEESLPADVGSPSNQLRSVQFDLEHCD